MHKILAPLLFTLLFFSSPVSWAKVDPPNYDFSLDTFQDFVPGAKLEEIEKKYGKGTKLQEAGGGPILRFMVEQLRYRFPVLVQIKAGIVDNYYAVLPSYFLHDVFHQSLINRFGMQQKYKKIEESAVYIWENVKGNTHVYSGTCTITCFPVYYTVYPVGASDTILKKLSDQSNYGKWIKTNPTEEEAIAL